MGGHGGLTDLSPLTTGQHQLAGEGESEGINL
jgi:hypothetical protein